MKAAVRQVCNFPSNPRSYETICYRRTQTFLASLVLDWHTTFPVTTDPGLLRPMARIGMRHNGLFCINCQNQRKHCPTTAAPAPFRQFRGAFCQSGT